MRAALRGEQLDYIIVLAGGKALATSKLQAASSRALLRWRDQRSHGLQRSRSPAPSCRSGHGSCSSSRFHRRRDDEHLPRKTKKICVRITQATAGEAQTLVSMTLSTFHEEEIKEIELAEIAGKSGACACCLVM